MGASGNLFVGQQTFKLTQGELNSGIVLAQTALHYRNKRISRPFHAVMQIALIGLPVYLGHLVYSSRAANARLMNEIDELGTTLITLNQEYQSALNETLQVWHAIHNTSYEWDCVYYRNNVHMPSSSEHTKCSTRIFPKMDDRGPEDGGKCKEFHYMSKPAISGIDHCRPLIDQLPSFLDHESNLTRIFEVLNELDKKSYEWRCVVNAFGGTKDPLAFAGRESCSTRVISEVMDHGLQGSKQCKSGSSFFGPAVKGEDPCLPLVSKWHSINARKKSSDQDKALVKLSEKTSSLFAVENNLIHPVIMDSKIILLCYLFCSELLPLVILLLAKKQFGRQVVSSKDLSPENYQALLKIAEKYAVPPAQMTYSALLNIFNMKGRFSIIEVRDKITAEVKSEKRDHICSISFDKPWIPVFAIKIPDGQQNELLSMLRWVEQASMLPLNAKEKVTLETFKSKCAISLHGIADFDKELNQYGYTRAELLKHYKISPELYQYLLRLDFQKKPDRLKKIKDYIAGYETTVIVSILLLLLAGFYFLYRKMLLSQTCMSSSVLDKDIYDSIYNEIIKKIKSDSNPDNRLVPEDCRRHWKRIFSILPTGYFNGTVIGLRSEELFFETTAARIRDHDDGLTMLLSAFYSSFMTGFCALAALLLKLKQDDDHFPPVLLCLLAVSGILIAMGLIEVITPGVLFNNVMSHPSRQNSYARACNDGYLLHRLTSDTIPPELSPVFDLPVCETPWLNVATMAYSLLGAPVSFFGARLIQTCRKKFNPSVEEQFEALRERKFKQGT